MWWWLAVIDNLLACNLLHKMSKREKQKIYARGTVGACDTGTRDVVSGIGVECEALEDDYKMLRLDIETIPTLFLRKPIPLTK